MEARLVVTTPGMPEKTIGALVGFGNPNRRPAKGSRERLPFSDTVLEALAKGRKTAATHCSRCGHIDEELFKFDMTDLGRKPIALALYHKQALCPRCIAEVKAHVHNPETIITRKTKGAEIATRLKLKGHGMKTAPRYGGAN